MPTASRPASHSRAYDVCPAPAAAKRSGRPRGKLVAVANLKGGVAKTTTVITLAESLLAEDMTRKVLVVDFDPQANASVTVAGDDALATLIRRGLTFEAFIRRRWCEQETTLGLDAYVHDGLSNTHHRNRRIGLSLLACGRGLRRFEREALVSFANDGMTLERIEATLTQTMSVYLEVLRERYDYVVFDCPPSVSLFAEAAIRAADLVIMPTIPDTISMYAVPTFVAEVWGGAAPKGATRPRVLVTRMQPVKTHKDMVDALEEEAKDPRTPYVLMRTRVPQSQAAAKVLDVEHGDAEDVYAKRYPKELSDVMKGIVSEVREATGGI